MNVDQIEKSLAQAFYKEGHHIAYNIDPKSGSKTDSACLALDNLQVDEMISELALAIKSQRELESCFQSGVTEPAPNVPRVSTIAMAGSRNISHRSNSLENQL